MRYRERLTVPWSWWLLAALFALSWLLAVGLYLGPVWGLAAGLLGLAVPALLFAALAVRLEVAGTEVRVGRAVLEAGYLSGAAVLDAEQTARRAGPAADARAHLVLRPYVATAVELTLDDPDDPVPYWLVSTRRPAALAAAVTAAVAATGRVR